MRKCRCILISNFFRDNDFYLSILKSHKPENSTITDKQSEQLCFHFDLKQYDYINSMQSNTKMEKSIVNFLSKLMFTLQFKTCKRLVNFIAKITQISACYSYEINWLNVRQF